jgi:hypothetical protein
MSKQPQSNANPALELTRLARQIELDELARYKEVCAGAAIHPELIRPQRMKKAQRLTEWAKRLLRTGLSIGVSLTDLECKLHAIESTCERLQHWELVEGSASRAHKAPSVWQVQELLQQRLMDEPVWQLTYKVENLDSLSPDQLGELQQRLLVLAAQRDYLSQLGRELEAALEKLHYLRQLLDETPETDVSEVARRIPGAKPKDISDLLYQRKLDDARCPLVGGRRLIPESYLPEIEAALRVAGRLPASKEGQP